MNSSDGGVKQWKKLVTGSSSTFNHDIGLYLLDLIMHARYPDLGKKLLMYPNEDHDTIKKYFNNRKLTL